MTGNEILQSRKDYFHDKNSQNHETDQLSKLNYLKLIIQK